MRLAEYKRKRDFKKTSEPVGGKSLNKAPIFVVQEHHASHLHYDFRLEAFGVLLSWAVPKGPSMVVGDKRLAVQVEDHPIDYAKFKGRIPEGEYGAGVVKIWDNGTWVEPKDLKNQLEKGHLEFELKGKKLKGKWLLQRTNRQTGSKSQWLLIKRHDDKKEPAKSKVVIPNKTKSQDKFPDFISPQLALLVDNVPQGDKYIHEVKFDGYRTQARIQGQTIELLTRSGLDWTEKYSPLDEELKSLKLKSAIMDGEIVVLDAKGGTDFSALQSALKSGKASELVFYVFDLLYVNGEDLRKRPLEERKLILKKILKDGGSDKIRYSEHVRGQGEELLAKMEKLGLEGIISKDRTLPYRSGRDGSWQKIKISKRQELVIGGFTDPEGSRNGLGALLMGVYENKKLRYIGRVGTGFNGENIDELMDKLEKFEATKSPFDVDSPKANSKVHWVKPKLVAEIEFKAWTSDGVLRHASFKGLREDKSATEVIAEKPVSAKSATKTKSVTSATSKKTAKASSKTKKSASTPENVANTSFRITHPERMIYPKDKVRKIDVANYYKSVAPWMLPHISERPLSLMRCPEQAGQNCFFQKHLDTTKMKEIRESQIKDQKVVYVDSEAGLLQLAQWGVLEPHTWQCHVDDGMHPDQIVFDLDPDGEVPWKEVAETAERLRDLLDRLDLKGFLKTTGGKGLHIHVPVTPLYSWDQIKGFAKTVCQQLESENPGHYTTKISKKTRSKKIFLDYLRNGFGATAVAPFSLRSKDHPTVAMPISWEELKKIKGGDEFDLESALKRLAHQKKDPWKDFFKTKQKIKILKPE